MLGLDVSKAIISYALVDAQQQRCGTGAVPNTMAGIDMLLGDIPPEHPWVLEPTGRYSGPIARAAVAAGRRVLLAPPREAKSFLGALHPRAKTDRLDSLGLAQYACAIPLRPYPVKSAAMDTLDQLLAARKGLAESLTRLRQQQEALPAAAPLLAPAVAALQVQERAVEGQIAAQAHQVGMPGMAALDAVPGIGPLTAAAVASCLTSKRFARPDQFVAYIGLDVRVRQSGQWQGQQRLSKRGHAEVRRLLYLAAQANLRTRDPHNPFKQQYVRERAKGLSSTAALNAVARKLARLCWSLVAHGTTYDPARVGVQLGRPPAPPLDTRP